MDLVLTADGVPLDLLSNHQSLMHLSFACILGDMNGDSIVDAFDVSWFEMALTDKVKYQSMIGIDPDFWGDFDGNGRLDAFDVDEFEQLLASGGVSVIHTVPEPACALWMLGGLLMMRRRRSRISGLSREHVGVCG